MTQAAIHPASGIPGGPSLTEPSMLPWLFSASVVFAVLGALAATAFRARNGIFWFLFAWRYVRQVVHFVAFWLYRPSPAATNPRYGPKDVTVILPTIDPDNEDFVNCLVSCEANHPGKIIVVTVGTELGAKCHAKIQNLDKAKPLNPKPIIILYPQANKRRQVAHALADVETELVALMDDHVMWGDKFLETAIRPFEDKNVAFVGTNKRVVRKEHDTLWGRILNMIQCLYLERHNHEIISSSTMVFGGPFVVSGRTSLIRSCVLKDPSLLEHFKNERILFGMFGPIAADDNNFLTRAVVARGLKIKIQATPETLIVTNLGKWAKFRGGLIRWARTTWRSNSASLLNRNIWYYQPWNVYAVYLSSFTNFALFYDVALIAAFALATDYPPWALALLLLWILFFKMVKPCSYFCRHPQDLVLLLAYFAFTYIHSFIKLYALMTFWKVQWSGRNIAPVAVDVEGERNPAETESQSDDQHPPPEARPQPGAEEESTE